MCGSLKKMCIMWLASYAERRLCAMWQKYLYKLICLAEKSVPHSGCSDCNEAVVNERATERLSEEETTNAEK